MNNPNVSFSLLHLPLYAAAIQRGLDLEIWVQPDKEPELAKLWEELGLLSREFQLNVVGTALVESQGLYRFEMASMERLVGSRYTYNRDTAYRLLRISLADRATQPQNQEVFKKMLPCLADERINVADLGGGAGGFLRLFTGSGRRVVVDADASVATLLDEGVEFVEFKLGLNHEVPRRLLQPEGFDVVLCSELLHLMPSDRAINALRQARDLVPLLGYVVVIENWPRHWFNWRLKRLSREGKMLGLEDVRAYAKAADLSFRSHFGSSEHYFALFQRGIPS